MDHLIPFIGHYWLLCGAFLVVLIAIIFVEGRDAGLTGGLRVSPAELTHRINRESAIVVDLQEIDAFREGHIVAARNIPFSTWSGAQAKLEKYRAASLILVDKSGQKAAGCASELQKKGFEQVKYLGGGLVAWREAKYPLIKGSK